MSSSMPIGRSGGLSRDGGAGAGTGTGADMGGGEETNQQTNTTESLTLISPSPVDIKLVLDYNKLKGQSNYVYWSDRSRAGLEYLGLWEYVTGEVPKPPLNNPVSRDIWGKNDKKALFFLNNRIEENLHARVRNCTTSSDL